MKLTLLLLLGCIATFGYSNTVRIYRTADDPPDGQTSFTFTANDLVGEYQSDGLDFTNWHPFGLQHFAVTITGNVYSNAPTGALFMASSHSNGWYRFSIGNMDYGFFYQGDQLFFRNVGETFLGPGLNSFELVYETSPYLGLFDTGTVMAGPTFESDLPYGGWGGDPNSWGYVVRKAPETGSTALLIAAALLALSGVPCARRQRRDTATAG